MLANELFPMGVPPSQYYAPAVRSETAPFKLARLLDIGDALPYEISRRWYALACQFTLCDLTVESDKLPAISGIARSFGEV
jgi:hypothetical protein